MELALFHNAYKRVAEILSAYWRTTQPCELASRPTAALPEPPCLEQRSIPCLSSILVLSGVEAPCEKCSAQLEEVRNANGWWQLGDTDFWFGAMTGTQIDTLKRQSPALCDALNAEPVIERATARPTASKPKAPAVDTGHCCR